MAESDVWLEAATGVLGRQDGASALATLEWDPGAALADADVALAFAALFRAQGRTLATTPALGLLVANHLLRPGKADLEATAVVRCRLDGEVVRALAVSGFDQAERVVAVLDTSGDGTVVAVSHRSVWEDEPVGARALDPAVARFVRARGADLEKRVTGEQALLRGSGAVASARLAVAHELLGVCDQLVDLAATYARDRHQFGVPIGSFQAVAQLLAEAEVHRRVLADACHGALARCGPDGPDAREVVLLKGLAGLSVRQVGQLTLQVFGAIGFTWEHPHHRFVRRGLTLDALFGSADQMAALAADQARADGVLRPALAGHRAGGQDEGGA